MLLPIPDALWLIQIETTDFTYHCGLHYKGLNQLVCRNFLYMSC